MTHAMEVLRTHEKRVREQLRGLTEDQLKGMAFTARPWKLSMIRDELLGRLARRRSVYYWLRNPAL